MKTVYAYTHSATCACRRIEISVVYFVKLSQRQAFHCQDTCKTHDYMCGGVFIRNITKNGSLNDCVHVVVQSLSNDVCGCMDLCCNNIGLA